MEKLDDAIYSLPKEKQNDIKNVEYYWNIEGYTFSNEDKWAFVRMARGETTANEEVKKVLDKQKGDYYICN